MRKKGEVAGVPRNIVADWALFVQSARSRDSQMRRLLGFLYSVNGHATYRRLLGCLYAVTSPPTAMSHDYFHFFF